MESDGSDIRRKYDFKYDETNRLLKSDFTQQNSDDNIWNSSQTNYSVVMGDGNSATSAYDANGNIKAMTQYGYKLGVATNTPIDKLTYNYSDNNSSNKLLNVIDLNNDPQTKLGDFRVSSLHPVQSKITTTVDYTYDENGNLITDLNKDIITFSGGRGILYNYFNLVTSITIKKDASSNKGTITYTYSADGAKLSKTVFEKDAIVPYLTNSYTSDITTITTYFEDLVYETKIYSHNSLSNLGYTDRLQFIGHEEGRIRFKASDNSLQYDYFISDHLGNIRMILTEETVPANIYQATIETGNRTTENQIFTNIPSTESPKPVGFDSDGNNLKVSKLFNATGQDKRVGPGVVLKVMAGDKFKALCTAWYQPGSTDNNTLPGATNIITNILSAFTGGLPVGGKYTGAEVSGSGLLNGILSSFLGYQTAQTNSTRPKAYLNWIVLDEEQLKLVQGNYGVVQVPTISGAMQKQVLQANAGAEIEILRNGYLYVYVSNESQGNVYFDDLRVEHTRGSLREETHYYPAGLQMSGISSQALDNQYIANEFKYQGQEYESSLGYNMLEFEARQYDPQLGRWHVQDPAGQFASPYLGMGNNWPNTTDPDGRYALIDDIVAGVIGGIVNLGAQLLSGNVHSIGQGFGFFGVGFASGVAAIYTGAIGAGAVSGFGNSLLSGSSLKEAALSGGIGALTGVIAAPLSSAIGGQIGSLTSGLGANASNIVTSLGTSTIVGGGLGAGGALFTGGNVGQGFADGALTGLISSGINLGANAGVDAIRNSRNGTLYVQEPDIKPVQTEQIPKTNNSLAEINTEAALGPNGYRYPVMRVGGSTNGLLGNNQLPISSLSNISETSFGARSINRGVLQKFVRHSFAKGRHNDLGLQIDEMAAKGYNVVMQNLNRLKAGDNTIHVSINGVQKTIMANVTNGAVRSMGMYHGISKRLTLGNVINLGNINW